MSREKRLTWFRCHGNIQGTLKAMPPETVGQAFLDVLDFFNFGEEKQHEDKLLDIAYETIKQGVLESQEEYQARREDGKRGAEAKKEKMREQLEQEMISKYTQTDTQTDNHNTNDLPFEYE